MNNNLQPGDRVLDLRAVCRAGGVLAGLVTAPLAAGLSGWWWPWGALAAVGAAAAGFATGVVVGRAAFPAPTGQAKVARIGPAALGIALRASTAGGLPAALACAVAAFLGAGAASAAITLLVGLGVSAGAGCLAAML